MEHGESCTTVQYSWLITLYRFFSCTVASPPKCCVCLPRHVSLFWLVLNLFRVSFILYSSLQLGEPGVEKQSVSLCPKCPAESTRYTFLWSICTERSSVTVIIGVRLMNTTIITVPTVVALTIAANALIKLVLTCSLIVPMVYGSRKFLK